jgi:hypothetical protein
MTQAAGRAEKQRAGERSMPNGGTSRHREMQGATCLLLPAAVCCREFGASDCDVIVILYRLPAASHSGVRVEAADRERQQKIARGGGLSVIITCVLRDASALRVVWGGLDLGLVRPRKKEKVLRVAFVCGPT